MATEKPVKPKKKRDPKDSSVKAAYIGATATVAAALIAAAVVFLTRTPGPSPSPTPQVSSLSTISPATSPPSTVPASTIPPRTGASGTLRRKGTLVLQGNGTAYDLDSLASDWDPLAGHTWIDQNIEFAPQGDSGNPLVLLAGSPGTDVVMSGKGPWSYQDCARAPYGANASTTGPNVIAGPALDIGRGICIDTQNTPLTSNGGPKTDGNHYGLLVVEAITDTTLTLEVTVWN